MKKTLGGRLRLLLMAMLATIAFTFNSCRKDLLVQGPNNVKNALSIAEAKNYFEAHIKVSGMTKTSAVSGNIPVTAESLVAGKRPMWEQAYQKLISTGGAVRIPIDFGNTYAVVNPKKGEVVPLSSLNYLLMYKDSLQAIRLEWVMLQPDSAWLYGVRSSYTGLITVRDWGGRIRKAYRYGKEGVKSPGTAVKTASTTSSNEGGMSQPICILVPTGNCPKIGVCSQTCDMCTNICAKRFCGWVPFCGVECELPGEPPAGPVSGGSTGIGGSAGGGSAGGGSGSGTGSGDYPPSCNPDPNYVMLTYPPPGGGSWQLPCGGPETVPTPVPLRLGHNLWTPEETDFLNQNPSIADAIRNYLAENSDSEEAREFVKWAVRSLMVNDKISLGHLEGIYRIQIDPNYIPRDKEPTSYYWRTRLSDSNGYDNFGAYLIETTPYYIYPNGQKTINLEAYNCHYYAFGLIYASEVDPDYPKWVLNVKIETKDWELVKGRVKVGDRIVYQKNTNEKLHFTHSAVVTEVDAYGYATKAKSKMSTFEVIEHHPRDMPISYGSTNATFTINVPAAGNISARTETHQSRLYWRKK